MDTSLTLDSTEIDHMAEKYPDVFVDETTKVLRLVTGRLESEVTRRTPRGVFGSSGLAGSIFGEVVPRGLAVSGMVGTPSPYGEVVETGRRPGKMPPIAPLALWAERKLGVSPEESTEVGFLIARKIARKGTSGAHMFERAWREGENYRWVMNMMNTIPARVARRITAKE
jgi:hypothetical protein